MKMRYWIALGLLSCSVVSLAAGPRAVRKQVELSMLVTGKITIDKAGKVSGFTLDQPEKLPPVIVDLASTAVPHWTFAPVTVDGKVVNASTGMSLRFVARRTDADNYNVQIRSAGFGSRADKPKPDRKESPAIAKASQGASCPSMAPPAYPLAGLYGNVEATAYLLVRADRDGNVLEAIAEQVNLRVIADDHTMEKWRRVFAEASVRQARKWCFAPVPPGEKPQMAFQVLRVPVVFYLDGTTEYGRWEAYVPGPRQRNPWDDEGVEGTAFSPDALPPGGAYQAGSGLKLLTGLSGS